MDQVDLFLAQWTEAERTSDVAALDALLTDDFLGVGPLGFMLSKTEWLGRHRAGDLNYDSYDLEDLHCRVYGDAVLVTARQVAHGTYRGQPNPSDLRATLAIVADAGSPRLAGTYLSFIAGTPGAPPIPAPPTSERKDS